MDGQADRQADMSKVPGALRNYANAPKNNADKIITARRQNWVSHRVVKE